MSLDQRLLAANTLKPELASMNMGSLNFGLFPAAEKISSFKQPWERGYLEMTKDFILIQHLLPDRAWHHGTQCSRHPLRVRML